MLSSLIGKALAQSQPAAVSPSDAGGTSTASPASPAAPSAPFAPCTSSASAPPPTSPDDRSVFSRRSLGQLGLFFAGATFVALSTTVTRRAVARRKLEAQLKFFQQSGGTVSRGGGAAVEGSLGGDGVRAASAAADPDPAPQGSLVALEALNLASLNVASFFIMLAGGLAWALDLSSMDDLQRLSHRNLRGSLTGERDAKADEEAERELSEFMTRMMGPGYGKSAGQPEEKPDDKTA